MKVHKFCVFAAGASSLSSAIELEMFPHLPAHAFEDYVGAMQKLGKS